jgi:biotin transport system substrate-specific component
MQVLRSGTLIEQLLPQTDFENAADSRDAAIVRDVVLVMAGVVLVALCAQITIPWHPVPLTGQTFAVLLVGGLYGMVRATVTLAAYFAVGLLGVGVFADGSSGWDYVQGPTGGYLVGFIVAAGFIGFMAERGLDRRVVPMIGALLVATAIIYALGAWWLAEWEVPSTGEPFGWSAAYTSGVEPFILGDLAKLAAVAGLLPAGWKIAEKLGLYAKKPDDPSPGVA